MVDRPTNYPRWATNDETDEFNVPTVIDPGEGKKNTGWVVFERPAYNIMNWIHKKTYEWILYLDEKIYGRYKVTNGNGVGVIPLNNSIIILYAINKATPTQYIHAIGYRGTGNVTFNVLSNNTLTLGTSVGSNQPINGATPDNIIIYAQFKILGD